MSRAARFLGASDLVESADAPPFAAGWMWRRHCSLLTGRETQVTGSPGLNIRQGSCLQMLLFLAEAFLSMATRSTIADVIIECIWLPGTHNAEC